jgi:hypothetical protein
MLETEEKGTFTKIQELLRYLQSGTDKEKKAKHDQLMKGTPADLGELLGEFEGHELADAYYILKKEELRRTLKNPGEDLGQKAEWVPK